MQAVRRWGLVEARRLVAWLVPVGLIVAAACAPNASAHSRRLAAPSAGGMITVTVGAVTVTGPAVLPRTPGTHATVLITKASSPASLTGSRTLAARADYDIPPCSDALALDGPVLPDAQCTPPTKTGALGVSNSTWAAASDVAKGLALAASAVSAYTKLAAIFTALPSGGASVATLGTISAVAGGVAVGFAGLSYLFDHLKDPADSDYTTLARVRKVIVPASLFGDTVVGRSAQAYVQAQLRIAQFATAFITSVDRATGAAQAGAKHWVVLQRRRAAMFAVKTANVLSGNDALRQNLVSAASSSGATITITPADAQASQSYSDTEPAIFAKVIKLFTGHGIAPQITAGVERSLAHPTVGTLSAPLQFPQALLSTSLTQKESTVISALYGWANAYGASGSAR